MSPLDKQASLIDNAIRAPLKRPAEVTGETRILQRVFLSRQPKQSTAAKS